MDSTIVGFNINSIKRQSQPFNQTIGFNVNSIQKRIEPLNPQVGFNTNYNQRQIEPCQFHSKTDSTIKRTNRIKRQFYS